MNHIGGKWITESGGICNMAMGYFVDLFKSECNNDALSRF